MYISKPFEVHMLHETEPFEFDMYRLVLTDNQYNQLLEIREHLNTLVAKLDHAYLHGVTYICPNTDETLHVQSDPETNEWAPLNKIDWDNYEHLPELLSITVTKSELVIELQSDYGIAEGELKLETDFEYVEDSE